MSEFADLHDDLRAVAREILGAAGARTAGGEPVIVERAQLAAAGWFGLEVPGELGGAGATFAEMAVIAEELGRAAAATPFFGTAVLGVGALLACEPSPRRDELLAAIAAGDLTVAVALPTGDGGVGSPGWSPAGSPPSRARGLVGLPPGRSGAPTKDAGSAALVLPFRVAGGRVDGTATFVPDAADADVVLLLGTDADTGGAAVLVVAGRAAPAHAVDPAAVPSAVTAAPAVAGDLRIIATPVLDATRHLATVTAIGLAVDDGDVLRLTRDPAGVVGRGALAVAIDSLGIAEAMLAATVGYTKERHQFDRAIGSFQAVKHQLADALVQVTLSRELVAAAIADPTAAAVSMAKAHATAMAVEVAGTALQLHGGIGYTWEGPVHVHLKRATLNRSLFGSPRSHRRRLAERYTNEGERHG